MRRIGLNLDLYVKISVNLWRYFMVEIEMILYIIFTILVLIPKRSYVPFAAVCFEYRQYKQSISIRWFGLMFHHSYSGL